MLPMICTFQLGAQVTLGGYTLRFQDPAFTVPYTGVIAYLLVSRYVRSIERKTEEGYVEEGGEREERRGGIKEVE